MHEPQALRILDEIAVAVKSWVAAPPKDAKKGHTIPRLELLEPDPVPTDVNSQVGIGVGNQYRQRLLLVRFVGLSGQDEVLEERIEDLLPESRC